MKFREIADKLEPARTSFHFLPGFTGASLCRFGIGSWGQVGLALFSVVLVVSLGNAWLWLRDGRATNCIEVALIHFMRRFSRKDRHTDFYTLGSYFVGIIVLWLAWACLPSWLVSFPAVLVAMVDPAGKVGKFDQLAIHRFQMGWWKGKSVGGYIAGLVAGVVAMYLWVSTYFWYEGYLPAPTVTVAVTYTTGVVAAVTAELLAGDFDNFAIPTVSLVAMASVYMALYN